jgi:ribosomal protein L16 Arg81 hydroxylase
MRDSAMTYEAVRPASAFYDLARLISPIGVDEFFEEYYERKPLLVRRSDRSYYQDLFTLADLDRALVVANLRADMTRVVIDGVETPLSELLKSSDELARGNELEVIYQRYREGFTVVVNTIDERHEGLKRLCRSLDNDGGFNPQVNLYLTPPENRGFRPHYDTHDVFMVQVYGSKRWSLFGAPAELPTRNQRWRTPEDGPGEPTMEFTLEAGDVVYLPRGTVHAGTSTDEASLHVTIGLHPVLWADVFKKAVREVVEGDVAFRRSLPVGYTHDAATQALAEGLAKQLAVSLANQLPAPESIVSDSAWERVVNQRHPELMGHLVDLQQVGSVGGDTLVRRRPEVQALFGVGTDSVSVAFNGKSVEFPARVAAVVRDVVERDDAAFTPAQIAGDLDEAGRIVLVTVLLKEGYLTLA